MTTAAELAAVHGLEGLTVGRLASATGLSKAGVFGHYGSKEALQAAVVEAVLEQFNDEVIVPALEHPRGLARVHAFVDGYLDYATGDASPGGCFFTAAGTEFERRPGPIRDRLTEIRASWFAMTEEELTAARDAGELRNDADPAQLAFELVVLLQGTNSAFQLSKDPTVLNRGRAAIADRLARAPRRRPPRRS
jgi:AcrR family transcriptional regulator